MNAITRRYAEMMVADLPDAAADEMFDEIVCGDESFLTKQIFGDCSQSQEIKKHITYIERFSAIHVCLHTTAGKINYWPTTLRWSPKGSREKARFGNTALLAYLQSNSSEVAS